MRIGKITFGDLVLESNKKSQKNAKSVKNTKDNKIEFVGTWIFQYLTEVELSRECRKSKGLINMKQKNVFGVELDIYTFYNIIKVQTRQNMHIWWFRWPFFVFRWPIFFMIEDICCLIGATVCMIDINFDWLMYANVWLM